MKNATSIDLDSTFAPKQPEQPQPQKQEEAPVVKINWSDIMTEWCYRIPKGYPTVVDGVFTEYEEVKVLNEILEEKFGETIPLPEANLQAPNSKDTDYKEGMVIYFLGLDEKDFKSYYEYFSNPQSAKKLPSFKKPPHTDYFKPGDIDKIKSAVEFLGSNQAGVKGQKDLRSFIEPFAAAKTIRDMFGQQFADRGVAKYKKLRDTAAVAASELIQKERVDSDKWCPADIFIYGGNIPSSYFDNKPLNLGAKNINGSFVTKPGSIPAGKIVGISLKESEARAGKAKSFQDVLTRKSSYPTAPTLSEDLKAHVSILYHTEEALKDPTKLYYLSEVARRLSKLKSLQTNKAIADFYKTLVPIVTKAFGGVLGKEKAKKAGVEGQLNSRQIKAISEKFELYAKAIQQGVQKIYDKERGTFAQEAKRLKYKISQPTSRAKVKPSASATAHTLLKKAGCYQIASWFITGLDKGDLDIPEAFKSLSRERGAFVALTAYAVGMGGISPNFLKVKGATTPDGGHVETFYGSGFLKAVGDKMEIIDSPDYKGFQVIVTTAAYESNDAKAKPAIFYKTVLDFRYSGDALFIEVGRLTPTQG
jgi:hypothetical protein